MLFNIDATILKAYGGQEGAAFKYHYGIMVTIRFLLWRAGGVELLIIWIRGKGRTYD